MSGRALCLSGGGYRAAIFHLGALLRLRELDWLPDVALVSSVSGGSIASAWLAARYRRGRASAGEGFAQWCRRADFRAEVIEPFRTVAGTDLRTWAVLSTLPVNWAWPSPRVAALQRAYQRFFDGMTLGDLPESPRFVFCATNLTVGANWEFSRERVGDFQLGYLRRARNLPVALAVAASSSFPPVFGPVRLAARASDFARGSYRGPDREQLRERVELSDGGVYDNLGMEPALRRYDDIRVSDAGAPFPFRAGQHYLRRLLRYTEVVGSQAVALRKRLFFALRQSGRFQGAYWGLADAEAGADGYGEALVADVLSRLRTDLDPFLDDEFDVLVNHGYFTCEAGVSRQAPASPAGPAAAWPFPALAVEDEVRRRLASSHRRMFHGRWWARARPGP